MLIYFVLFDSPLFKRTVFTQAHVRIFFNQGKTIKPSKKTINNVAKTMNILLISWTQDLVETINEINITNRNNEGVNIKSYYPSVIK
jgi:hypothetical protein